MNFIDYYHQTRQREPFPWMCRLAERFAALDLPDVIDLPTGCGKTEIVIIWAWARQQNPQLHRRLWMASDRRVIVDQTWEVARALGDDVRIGRLRGGIAADDDTMLDPIAAQVISSTVDQLGSRLLYRAYGASPRSWPIWAGLAGNDSLIVLDEAHLSPTAEDTFRACARMGAGIHMISMTATPRMGGQKVFRLGDDDRSHPLLTARLAAKRFVELRQAGSLAAAATELLEAGLERVAVVCNTVRSARQVFEAIGHQDKHLIIGRQRSLDRERIMETLLPRVRCHAESSAPLVVVATQCIEAGADLDFDGMVSEACPIDALRQRLGRLDRLGKNGESRCIVMASAHFADIPPYGKVAVQETWRWLKKHARKNRIDLGAEGWETLAELIPDEARSTRPEPVSFLEPHLRMLARTSPRPRVEPDIDLLLHGPARGSGAVSVVWRRDVDPADASAANEILHILPPVALEACEVPVWELRAWLMGNRIDADAGDIEGAMEPARQANSAVGRPVVRWDGLEDGAVRIDVQHIRAGNVLVLPANLGGYDAFGWAPASVEPVIDIAEAAFLRAGRRIERLDDPDAEVDGDLVHRWSGGVVVETFGAGTRSRRKWPEVSLESHVRHVTGRARSYARELGLCEDDLGQAGFWHDAGKGHPGWQLCIKEGDPGRLAEPPLAKGHYVRSLLSRLPKGWRHEAESLARLPLEASGLVVWLVATHHGYARPFWPIKEHGIGLAELMDKLQAEHGYWRLALHEAVLRCADRAVSKEEEMQ